MKRVLIIGGGASGLMAAVWAAKSGAKVTLLEKENKLGKKILASGGGRCNLTNTGDPTGEYRGHDPSFAASVLQRFSVEETLSLFESLGLLMTDHDHWIYPYSEQSHSVLRLLMNACASADVKIKTGEKVIALKQQADGTFLAETETWHYEAEAVILCGGTSASEVTSADNSVTEIARHFQHTILPYLPALTYLKSQSPLCRSWGGVRCQGRVTLSIDDKPFISKEGQLQLIDGGVSGIPVFQVSRYAAEALNQKKNVSVTLDFLPPFDDTALRAVYERGMALSHEKGVFLAGYFPEKLAQVMKNHVATAEDFVTIVKHCRLDISETGSLKNAQVASGGVATDDIDARTCESKKVKNLFICGEMLDIDGDCGGWNLQFAWSTGALAGKAAAGE